MTEVSKFVMTAANTADLYVKGRTGAKMASPIVRANVFLNIATTIAITYTCQEWGQFSAREILEGAADLDEYFVDLAYQEQILDRA